MAIPYPRSSKPFTRDPASYAEDFAALEDVAKEIGYLTYAWNYLQQSYLTLFIAVMGIGNDQQKIRTLIDIWHSFRSDSTQRGLILAAAPEALKRHPLQQDVIDVVNEADRLASHRNDATHAPLSLVGLLKIPAPDTGMGNPLAKRLTQKKNLPRDLREATDYFMTLAKYVDELADHLHSSRGRPPLPQKPQLPPTLLLKNQKQKTQKQSRKDGQPPLGSSLGFGN